MDDYNQIPFDELKKATSPLHVNMSTFDKDRIIEAYPTLIFKEVMTEFNQQTDAYIVKQLIHLNIDKDVLIKQTEELNRLNRDVQKLCGNAYQQGRKDAIEEIQNRIDELDWYSIYDGNLVLGASTDGEPLYKYSDIEKMFEQIGEQNND